MAMLAESTAGGISSGQIYWLAVFVIVAAMTGVWWALRAGQALTRVGYRIALALLCFALSSVSALLFVANVEVKGNIELLSITLAGPSILWLAALIVVTKVLWDEDKAFAPIASTNSDLGSESGDNDWLPYSAWKFRNARLNYLFQGDLEEHSIKEVFNNAYYRSPQRKKLSSATIFTCALYYPRGSTTTGLIKLQRVTGVTDTPPVEMFHIAVATLPGGPPASFLLAREEDRVVQCEAGRPGSGRWCQREGRDIDVLIISNYPDGTPIEGDYFWIDAPKYAHTMARTEFSAISARPIERKGDGEPRAWEIRPARARGTEFPGGLPIMFRQRDRGQSIDRTTSSAGVEGLGDWLNLLDDVLARTNEHKVVNAETCEFLKGILDTVHGPDSAAPSFANLMLPAIFPFACQFPGFETQNPIIYTFQWGNKKPNPLTGSTPG